jgi:hypothetical protein
MTYSEFREQLGILLLHADNNEDRCLRECWDGTGDNALYELWRNIRDDLASAQRYAILIPNSHRNSP